MAAPTRIPSGGYLLGVPVTVDGGNTAYAPASVAVDANGNPTTGGGGGGGGATTIADGADVAEGSRADAPWNGSDANGTIVSILKALWSAIRNRSSTATPSFVPASTNPATLLPANAARLGATIFYDGSATLYLLEGTGTPSPTNFTGKLGAGYSTYYEAPDGYTGAVQGIWTSATGQANISVRTA